MAWQELTKLVGKPTDRLMRYDDLNTPPPYELIDPLLVERYDWEYRQWVRGNVWANRVQRALYRLLRRAIETESWK